MAFNPRVLRRSNPITFLLLLVAAVGFLYLILSPSSDTLPDMTRRIGQQGVDKISQWKQPANGRVGGAPKKVYKMNGLEPTGNPIANRETVLVLTPIAKFYPGYWENLMKLTYPRELVSLGFIIPHGREGNAAMSALNERLKAVQDSRNPFRKVTVLRQDVDLPIKSQNEKERHKLENQVPRRSAMAKARNSLLFTTLGPDNSWVLWLDADIVETPESLIQDLASHNKPVIVPNCYQRFYNENKRTMDTRPYDFNSWINTDFSRSVLNKLGYDDVLFEGYAETPTYRTLMAHLYEPNGDAQTEIELDGVGGTALMVKSDVHRDGAMFPPFPFYNLIETEGFAKMAHRLGWQSYGLPNYLVYHVNE